MSLQWNVAMPTGRRGRRRCRRARRAGACGRASTPRASARRAASRGLTAGRRPRRRSRPCRRGRRSSRRGRRSRRSRAGRRASAAPPRSSRPSASTRALPTADPLVVVPGLARPAVGPQADANPPGIRCGHALPPPRPHRHASLHHLPDDAAAAAPGADHLGPLHRRSAHLDESRHRPLARSSPR